MTQAKRRRPRRAQTKPQVAELHVVLQETEPAVWRRVRVAYDTPLHELHRILVVAMGWQGYHLHAFKAGDLTFGQPDDERLDDTTWEDGVTLRDIAPAVGGTFVYQYDFGDNWQHLVTLEGLGDVEPDTVVPTCTGGARACPPEDVGGMPGYQEMLDVLSGRHHRATTDEDTDDEATDGANSSEFYREWLGYEFDPDEFHLRCINQEYGRLLAFGVAFQG